MVFGAPLEVQDSTILDWNGSLGSSLGCNRFVSGMPFWTVAAYRVPMVRTLLVGNPSTEVTRNRNSRMPAKGIGMAIWPHLIGLE